MGSWKWFIEAVGFGDGGVKCVWEECVGMLCAVIRTPLREDREVMRTLGNGLLKLLMCTACVSVCVGGSTVALTLNRMCSGYIQVYGKVKE